MPPSTPAVAGKASKAKSKSTKTNTTNRVRKPAPTHRNTRGVNSNNTARTASPDYPSPSGQADLEAENARLQRQLKHHRHRSRHPKQRPSGKDDSEDDSSDSDVGDGRRVSFLHHYAGDKPFLKLHEHYPAVNIKYFKQIYWGTFQPSKSMSLAHDALTWSTTPKKKDDTTESSNSVQLLRCFEVYTHTICFFAARPHVALQLYEALVRYRIRLMDFSLIYDFNSIRTYHYIFMAKRILSGQDNPVAWLQEDYDCQYYLVPKPSQSHANLPLICSAESGNEDVELGNDHAYSPYHVGTSTFHSACDGDTRHGRFS